MKAVLRVWEMADEQWQARRLLLEARRKAVVLVAASQPHVDPQPSAFVSKSDNL